MIPLPPRCPSGKRRYVSQAEAEPYLHGLRVQDHPSRAAKLSIYGPCPQCNGGYHIGHDYGHVRSRTQRRGKHVKRKTSSSLSR